ncbi:MAG: MOSC domain-containing protein [Saprospiraceae bacterium]|nr:MOSC domain-containing protein [Saprospiraceae bacterium]
MSNLQSLLHNHHQEGTIAWIGVRPNKKVPLQATESVALYPEDGIVGDHYQGRSKKRQVTIIQEEHLEAMGNILQRNINPEDTRRNLVIKGINILALTNQRFQIGTEVVLEATGACHPCSRMESNLGPGGYQAMRGHGGITAMVIQGGTIRVGDKVQAISEAETTSQ